MSLWKIVTTQFGNPSGVLGSIAGFIMAHRASNRERNAWAVELLNLQLSDNVMEIGFGPGLALEIISKSISTGKIYGVDHSKKMFKLASKRNYSAVSSNRMKLFHASISDLPESIKNLDKVLDINTFQFWQNHLDILCNIKKRMSKEGTIVIIHQPRKPGSTQSDADEVGEKISSLLKKAGFKNIAIHNKNLEPVAAFCVIGNV